MKITETDHMGAGIFTLNGRLDTNTAPELEAEIGRAIENGKRKLIIDFQSLSYISSAGLRVILKTAKDLKRLEGRLLLCNMKDYVREVFEIAGFDTILPISPSLDAAIADLSA